MPARSVATILRRIVRCCASSAAAYKGAYMRCHGPELESRCLDRCAARYAALEELVAHLVEGGTSSDEARRMLRTPVPERPEETTCESMLQRAQALDRLTQHLAARLLAKSELRAGLRDGLALLYLKLTLDRTEHLMPLPPDSGRLIVVGSRACELDRSVAPPARTPLRPLA